jgi:hypothetical protein
MAETAIINVESIVCKGLPDVKKLSASLDNDAEVVIQATITALVVSGHCDWTTPKRVVIERTEGKPGLPQTAYCVRIPGSRQCSWMLGATLTFGLD